MFWLTTSAVTKYCIAVANPLLIAVYRGMIEGKLRKEIEGVW